MLKFQYDIVICWIDFGSRICWSEWTSKIKLSSTVKGEVLRLRTVIYFDLSFLISFMLTMLLEPSYQEGYPNEVSGVGGLSVC